MATKRNENASIRQLADWYLTNFPENLPERLIGLEKEYPVVTRGTYEAADVRKIFPCLRDRGWQPIFDDVYQDELMGVRRRGVRIGTDVGRCTLEIAVPPARSVVSGAHILQEAERIAASTCEESGMIVLGYGIQPVTSPDSRLWIKKRRNEIVRGGMPVAFCDTTITAADQVHLSISRHEIIDCVNVFNALTGPIIRLFAHSPFWGGRLDAEQRLAVRESMWSFAREKAGMPTRRFSDLEDFLSYMARLRFNLARRRGKYVVPAGTFLEWMMEGDDWHEQWRFHEGLVWLNARPRVLFGTVEIRPACSQRSGAIANLAALAAGVIENLAEAVALVDSVPWSRWVRFREQAIRGVFDDALERVTKDVLAIAQTDLERHTIGEVSLLEPLWQRAEKKTNPAHVAAGIVRKSGLEGLIRHVAVQ